MLFLGTWRWFSFSMSWVCYKFSAVPSLPKIKNRFSLSAEILLSPITPWIFVFLPSAKPYFPPLGEMGRTTRLGSGGWSRVFNPHPDQQPLLLCNIHARWMLCPWSLDGGGCFRRMWGVGELPDLWGVLSTAPWHPGLHCPPSLLPRPPSFPRPYPELHVIRREERSSQAGSFVHLATAWSVPKAGLLQRQPRAPLEMPQVAPGNLQGGSAGAPGTRLRLEHSQPLRG